jgi:hypothetical protein
MGHNAEKSLPSWREFIASCILVKCDVHVLLTCQGPLPVLIDFSHGILTLLVMAH